MAKRRPPKQEESKYGTLFVVVLIPIVTFVGGTIIAGYSFYDRIATKPYVDERVETSRKESEERTMRTLKEAYEHSDTNRREMMMSTERMIGELKVRNAIVDTKLETLLKSIQDIKDWTSDTNKKVRGK